MASKDQNRKKSDPRAEESVEAPVHGVFNTNRGFEALGIGMLLASVALCIALVSFDPRDASGHSNLVGPVGGRLAEFLLASIGVVGYVAALFCVGFAGAVVLGRARWPSLLTSLSAVGLLVSATLLAQLLSGGTTILERPAGGVAGLLVSRALVRVVGTGGAALAAVGLFLVSLIGMTDLSFRAAFLDAKRLLKWCLARAGIWVNSRRAARQRETELLEAARSRRAMERMAREERERAMAQELEEKKRIAILKATARAEEKALKKIAQKDLKTRLAGHGASPTIDMPGPYTTIPGSGAHRPAQNGPDKVVGLGGSKEGRSHAGWALLERDLEGAIKPLTSLPSGLETSKVKSALEPKVKGDPAVAHSDLPIIVARKNRSRLDELESSEGRSFDGDDEEEDGEADEADEGVEDRYAEREKIEDEAEPRTEEDDSIEDHEDDEYQEEEGEEEEGDDEEEYEEDQEEEDELRGEEAFGESDEEEDHQVDQEDGENEEVEEEDEVEDEVEDEDEVVNALVRAVDDDESVANLIENMDRRSTLNRRAQTKGGPTIHERKHVETQFEDAECAAPSEPVKKEYQMPALGLLDYEGDEPMPIDGERLRLRANRLEEKLRTYGVEGKVVSIRPGPVVTTYEYQPAPGVKVSKIASLSDDIAMSMEALRVRIVAPIPGRGVVGIELPNDRRENVYLKELIANDEFKKSSSPLTLALGKDAEGEARFRDLRSMPHLLMAGTTGSGKSVSMNTVILSILYKATPDQVKFIMVDPKMLELSLYQDIPHLLLPVVTDPKKASIALQWAVDEMERRYQMLSDLKVRSIESFNRRLEKLREKRVNPSHLGEEDKQALDPWAGESLPEPLPYIVVLIDEFADLMCVAPRDVEASVQRLAQKARAAGIHMLLATQRPSTDVITGVIKNNFPSRISFRVASRHDSATILNAPGAENLLGRGDSLFLSVESPAPVRIHGAFVSETEVERVVDFWRAQAKPKYDPTILESRREDDGDGARPEEADEHYAEAVRIVLETRKASISALQRRLRVGYNRAARMIEMMETEGIVGPASGPKGEREVLVP